MSHLALGPPSFDRSSGGDASKSPAANQSPQQVPAITLSTGGGAIRGTDEKFQANPATGSGNMTVPLATSPARQGFGPQLALTYDSGGGSGPFGLGWRLSLPSIMRKTDKGLPTYQDGVESDVFILSDQEDLVPVLVEGGDTLTRQSQQRTLDGVPFLVQRYRPRIEGLFARVERWTNQQTGEVHWRSISRDNVTTLYGRTDESRIADPDDPRRVFRWLICESYDDRGNAASYRYMAEGSANVDLTQAHERNRTTASRTANRYLKRIRYGNRTPHQPGEDLAARTDWMFEVVFDYGEGHLRHVEIDDEGRQFVTSAVAAQEPWPVRQDPTSSYRATFEVRTYRLCRHVLMFHHFPDELNTPDYLVRATHFSYDESPINSVMTAVVQSGYLRQADGSYHERSLPPVEFEYSAAVLGNDVYTIDTASLENLAASLSSGYRWVDLDGEGIPGILTEQGPGWFYKPNLGGARFAPQETVAVKPSLAALSSGQQLLDLAGDGQLDLVLLDSPVAGFYERTFERTWADHQPFSHTPSVDWDDPNLRFVDLTGDGHADILVTEAHAFTWYPSLAEDGFGESRRVPQAHDDEAGPRLVLADGTQSIYLADMTGDGSPDLARIQNGLVCYWPSLGYGRFGAKVTMDGAPWFDVPDRFDHERIQLADVDGSGITDILYIHNDRVAIYFNQAGNGWAPAQFVDHFASTDSLSDVTVTDLLGNGTACLVWSSPLPGDMNRQIRYIDLMGGRKPHLMIATRNNLGAETRVHYAASTRFYLDDKAAGRPWITRLPFPVHVVEYIETYDHISRSRFVTRYAYHHGYFDGVEREFRGFGLVEQFDTEVFATLSDSHTFPVGDNVEENSHVPPVHIKTWFHTGVYLGRQGVSRYFAGSLDTADTDEYYREPGLSDVEAARLLLPDTILPDGLTADEEREACRALKGVMLRQEVYALDGTDRAPHPFSVIEQNYTIRAVQRQADNRHCVFLRHARETLSYHYERNPADPSTAHSLTLAVDDFGNVLQSVSIGYGRRVPDAGLTSPDQNRQTQHRITCTENVYTNAVDQDDHYRTPLPAEALSHELTGLTLAPDAVRFTLAELAASLATVERIAYHETPTGGLHLRLIEHVGNLYQRDNLDGALPLGALEPLGLPFESYQLAFTPAHLDLVYGERVTDAMLSEEGGYVHFDGDDAWWIPSGRVFMSPADGDDAAQELAFAQQHFFIPVRFRDPFSQTTTVTYDDHNLLLLETRDSLGNRITAGERVPDNSISPRLDYRVLKPDLMTDSNGNRQAVAFDVLGLVAGTAVMGKAGENAGDTLDNFEAELTQSQVDAFLADPRGPVAAVLLSSATSRIVYDEARFQRLELPPLAATILRETHASDLDDARQSALQVSLAYSDGFSRVIQSKIQAEPGPLFEGGDSISPRWTASGWTIFNNKGSPVQRYEPFFTADHAFEFGVTVGVSSTQLYDPFGRVVAMLHPDHTWEKVVFDPWQQAAWDVNDTVLITNPANDPDVGGHFERLDASEYLPTWHEARAGGGMGGPQQDAAQKTGAHAATPTITHFDALGRLFLSIADNGPDGQYATRTEQDIEGNPLRIIDARGNTVVAYQLETGGSSPVTGYDVAGRQLYERSMDAGERRVLPDTGGKLLRSWTSRGHVRRTRYDALRRPTHLFVQLEEQREILAERTVYGEGHPQAAALNLHGQVYQVYDGAGVVTNHRFDFKRNLLESTRQLASQYRERVDWSVLVDLVDIDEFEAVAPLLDLEAETFASTTAYDALNRPVAVTTPDASVTLPAYNEAGRLQQVAVRLRGAEAATSFVTNIDYNARGERELINYATTDGANVTTRYTYDPDTFRLVRLRTVRQQDGRMLQDLQYVHDPAGHITSVRDDAQQTVFFGNTQIEPHRDYTYDAVYRLVRAEGREHAAQNNVQRDATEFGPAIGIPFPNSPEALQRYVQTYTYDDAGNLLTMRHVGGAVERWTRRYDYATDSNHLLATSLPGDGVDEFSAVYAHDAHGNMTAMPHLPLMRWDFEDQLQATSQQVVTNGGAPETTYYVYNAAGERVRKVTERQVPAGTATSRLSERIYIGDFEVYREFGGDSTTVSLERETLYVIDVQRRIVQVDTRTQGDDGTPSQSRRYQLANHLGSVALEVDAQANVISYEEYHPYGTSAFRAGRTVAEVNLRRHRYTGKERDEETRLYYHGARYYACWLGRWTAADPVGTQGGMNLYAYAVSQPISFVDKSGTAPAPVEEDPYEGYYVPSVGESSDNYEFEDDVITVSAEEQAAYEQRLAASRQIPKSWKPAKGQRKTVEDVAAQVKEGMDTGAKWTLVASSPTLLMIGIGLLPAAVGAGNLVAGEGFAAAAEFESTIATGLSHSSLTVRLSAAGTLIGLEYLGLNPSSFAPTGNAGAARPKPKPPRPKRTVTTLASNPFEPAPPPAPIQGNAQWTTRPDHALKSKSIARDLASEPQTESVHLNQQWRTFTDKQTMSTKRPDVASNTKGGTYESFEIPSPSDDIRTIVKRNLKVMLELGDKSEGLTIVSPYKEQVETLLRNLLGV